MDIQIQKFILILLRIASFIVICPGLSFKGLPNIFKLGLATSITLLVYMALPPMDMESDMLVFGIFAIKETLFGLAMGYVTNIIFSTMEIAGQLIDFQVGFSMASVYDPSIGIQASNYGRIYYWMSLCIFFILDMHHMVLGALIKSFEYVPLSLIAFDGFSVAAIVSIFSKVFETAVNLAAPMIIVVLVTDVVLGIISRAVPQINVLMLGMPLKTMVSFITALVALSWLMNSIGSIVQTMPEYLERFINLFSGM